MSGIDHTILPCRLISGMGWVLAGRTRRLAGRPHKRWTSGGPLPRQRRLRWSAATGSSRRCRRSTGPL